MSFRLADDTRSISSSSTNALSYAESYTKIVQQLRQTLIEQADDTRNQRSLVRSIFNRMDDNASGVLTVQEMKEFLQSPELRIFQPDDPFCEKFCELILEQIDINRDGNVSLEELEDFLFPSSQTSSPSKGNKNEPEHFETGIVLDFARKALIQMLSGAAAIGSDEALLAEFSSLAKVSVKKGKQIESRIAKKAFSNLYIPQFKRNLIESEVEALMKTIDVNGDGFITAKEFKGWLIPSSQNEEKLQLSLLLRSVIDDKFGGDERALFDEFKSYGADCIYKGDFVTNLKALDNTISRQVAQELSNALAGNEKGITYGRFQDFLGLGRSSVRFEDTGSQQQSPRSTGPSTFVEEHHEPFDTDLPNNIDMDDVEEPVAVVEDPETLDFSLQAGSTIQTMDSLDVAANAGPSTPKNMQRTDSRIPFSSQEFAEDVQDADEMQSPPDGEHRTFSRHNSGSSMRSMSTLSFENKSVKSPSRIDHNEDHGNTNSASKLMMKQRSLPNTMMRSILKQEQERFSDTGATEESSPLARTKSGIPSMESKNPSGLTSQELHYVRELLQQGRNLPSPTSTSPFAKSPPLKKVSLDHGVNDARLSQSQQLQFQDLVGETSSQQMNQLAFELSQSMTSPSKLTESKLMKHGAVGLSAGQLVEFGYYKHSGKWRGFPLDSWSCCNTSSYICPNAKNYVTPKESTAISSITAPSFISTTRLSPKKLRDSTEVTTRFSTEFESQGLESTLRESADAKIKRIPITIPPKPTTTDETKLRLKVTTKSMDSLPPPPPTSTSPISSSTHNIAPPSDLKIAPIHLQPKPNRTQILEMKRARAQSQNIVSKNIPANVVAQRAKFAISAVNAFKEVNEDLKDDKISSNIVSNHLSKVLKVSNPKRKPALKSSIKQNQLPMAESKDTETLSKAYMQKVQEVLNMSDIQALQSESERNYAQYEQILLDLRQQLEMSKVETIQTRSLMNHMISQQNASMSRLRNSVLHRMDAFKKVINKYPSVHQKIPKKEVRSLSAPPRLKEKDSTDKGCRVKEDNGDSRKEDEETNNEDTKSKEVFDNAKILNKSQDENATNISGIEALFPKEKRNRNKAPSSLPNKNQLRKARSMSPNHRVTSSMKVGEGFESAAKSRPTAIVTRYDESYHPPVRNIKHKVSQELPWVPPSTHSNGKFNRANAMDPNHRHHQIVQSKHQEPNRSRSPLSTYHSQPQPKYSRSRPKSSYEHRTHQSRYNEDDDFFQSFENDAIQFHEDAGLILPKRHSPEKDQPYSHLDYNKLMAMLNSPNRDIVDESKNYARRNTSSIFQEVKKTHSPTNRSSVKDSSTPVFQQSRSHDEEFEQYYRSPPSKYNYAEINNHQEEIDESSPYVASIYSSSVSSISQQPQIPSQKPIPGSPLLEAMRSFQSNIEGKDDWWTRIMAEKQRREQQAFFESLQNK